MIIPKEGRQSKITYDSDLYSVIETLPSVRRRRKYIICLILFLVIIAVAIIIYFILRSNNESNDNTNPNEKVDRIQFTQSINPEKTHYILNTKDSYTELKNLKLSTDIYNSSNYTYQWESQDKNTETYFKEFIPFNSSNYWDITQYDYIYLKIYSHKKTSSYFRIIIYCQERGEGLINAYYSYPIQINWEGWKDIWIPLSIFESSYNPNFTKVTNIKICSSGWDMVPNPETILNIDTILFTKANFDFNINNIPDEQYSYILNRLVQSIILNLTDTENITKITSMLNYHVNVAKDLQKNLDKSGKNPPFNYKMTVSSNMKNIYDDIKKLAMGYSIKGSDLYKNSTLLNDILYALDYMHENYYTKRDQNIFTESDNWWDWEIGCSNTIVDILAMIHDEINENDINKYLTPVNTYAPLPGNYWANTLSLAYTCVFSAVLQKNYKKIAISVEMLRDIFNKVENGEGFYDDGSFIQHMYIAYNGGYGNELIKSFAYIGYSLYGTYFSFDNYYENEIYNLVINSILPFIYKGAFFDLVRGRSIARNSYGISTTKETMNSLCLIMEFLSNTNDYQNNLKSFVKYLYSTNTTYYSGYLAPLSVKLLINLENNDLIKPKKIENFAKVYSRMDKAISQNNNIAIGISMSSTRIGRYEALSGENVDGWYSGDGMIYIYLDPNDYASYFWQNVNHYRLPGTTISNAPRENKNTEGKNSLNIYDFVGGSYYDNNMVVAMKFASENKNNGFNSSLVGNKGYFLFDNVLICLGNNITSSDDFDIESIIENRKINGDFYINDQKVNTDNKNGDVNGKYLYIENYGGIYIPEYNNVKYNITDNNFIEIYFSYGKLIENMNYKYILLPGITKNEFEELVNNFIILSNNEIASVVQNTKTNETQYIFWQKGSFNNVNVEEPCVIIETQSKLYISDPTQKLKKFNIILNNKTYNLEPKNGYTITLNK